MLLDIARKRMSKEVARKKTGSTRITIRDIYRELQRLRRRVEDLEDLRDLNAAIEKGDGMNV